MEPGGRPGEHGGSFDDGDMDQDGGVDDMRAITSLVAILCGFVVVAGRFVSPSAQSSVEPESPELDAEYGGRPSLLSLLEREVVESMHAVSGDTETDGLAHDGYIRAGDHLNTESFKPPISISGRGLVVVDAGLSNGNIAAEEKDGTLHPTYDSTDADQINRKDGAANSGFPHETRPQRLRRRLSADVSPESRDHFIAARRKVRRNRPDLSPVADDEADGKVDNIFRPDGFGAPDHHERPREFSPVGSQARANTDARAHAPAHAEAHAQAGPARAVTQHVAPETIIPPSSSDRPAGNSHYTRDPIVIPASFACKTKSCCMGQSSLGGKRSCCNKLRAGYRWTSGRCKKVPCTKKSCCTYRNRQAKRDGQAFRMGKCCDALKGWEWKRIRGSGKCVRASPLINPSKTIPSPKTPPIVPSPTPPVVLSPISPIAPSPTPPTVPSPTPPIITPSLPQPTESGFSSSNPNKGATGASCQEDEDCLSATCVMETCREGRLGDRASCFVARDCDSGSCTTFALVSSAERVCCPGGQFFRIDGRAYCAQGPEGALCSDDWHCLSATCVMGTCREGRLGDRAACSVDSDCDSGRCGPFALASSTESVCCSGGQHFEIGGIAYCAQGPEGAMCSDDSHCRSGSSCALADYSPDATQVCCSSSNVMQFVQINQGGDGTTGFTANYCTGVVKDGGYCGFNAQCQSDVCVDNTCQPGKLEATEPCDDSSDCLNSACGLWSYSSEVGKNKVCCPSGGTVTGSIPGDGDDEEEGFATEVYCTGQPMRSPCHSAVMCASNESGESACALEEYTAGANMVCCPSGRSVPVRPLIARDCFEYTVTDGKGNTDTAMLCFDIAGNELDLVKYCTGMDSGMACRINDQCSSGVCVDGKCMDSPGGPWSSCDEDADCAGERAACGKGSYDADASNVCCPTGSETVDLPKAGSESERGGDIHRYCTSLPPNTPCYDDNMCGVVDERTGRQSACGLEEYVLGARRVCCPGGEAVRVFQPGSDFESDNYCAGLDTGRACGRDVLCLSGSCVNGVCA